MLLVMVDDKESKQQQAGEHTAYYFGGQVEVPNGPRQSARQQKRRGQNIPPTSRRRIRRVRFSCQYYFFAGSHAGFNFFEFRQIAFFCPNGKAKKMMDHLVRYDGSSSGAAWV